MWDDRDDLDLLDPIDEVLMADLKEVLRPPTVAGEPSADDLAALHEAVAARHEAVAVRLPDHRPGKVVAPQASRRAPRVRSIWRTGSAAAAIIVVSASAAAASGGVAMPRPVRALAYAVGLPVDSPALDDTHRHLQALDHALDEADRVEARRQVRNLQLAVDRVPDDERGDIADEVTTALAAAAPLLEGGSETNDAVEESPDEHPPATPASSGGPGTHPGFPTPTTAPTAVTDHAEPSTAEQPTTEAGTDAQTARDDAEDDSSEADPVAGPDEDAEHDAAPDPVTAADLPPHPDQPADAAP